MAVGLSGHRGGGRGRSESRCPRATRTASSIRFEPNEGQFEPGVRFVGQAGRVAVSLTDEAMALRLRGPRGCADTVSLHIAGAASVRPLAGEPLAAKSHYFLGNDPTGWHPNVPSFGEVRYPDVRPGVDLVWHGEGGALEYDLILAPGARVEDLVVEVEGSAPIALLPDGAISIPTPGGHFIQGLPIAYQPGEGGRVDVPARYRLVGPSRVAFEIARFDSSRPLVIDPMLTYSTLLGGVSADSAAAVAVDAAGSVYLTGSTLAGFPASASTLESTCAGDTDAFVAKLAADGQTLLYATYLGGSLADLGASIAVDVDGNAYVAGQTGSTDFPTVNALQTGPTGLQAGFLAMLDASGSMLSYSTYLGGSDVDTATAVAVDSSGNAYVTGQTQSATFPLAHPLQGAIAGGTDVFVAKLEPGGTTLAYSTFFGGVHDDEGLGIALDTEGDAYVTGGSYSPDFPVVGEIPGSGSGGALVFELDAAGSSVVYSTCQGAELDQGQAIAVDLDGNAYIAGVTASGTYPVLDPLPGSTSLAGTNAFVTRLATNGAAVVYSTLLGGSLFDSATGIAVDASGDAFVTGYTYSPDFPTLAPIQTDPITALNGIAAFVSEIEPDDSGLVFSTYLGGAGSTYGYSIAIGSGDVAYVAGATADLDFPTQNGLQPAFASSTAGSQAFLAEMGPGDRPLLVLKPSPASVRPLGSTTFHASGGSGGGYVFSLFVNASGGGVDPKTGFYTSGSHGAVLDVVLVRDSAGTTAAAAVLVGLPTSGDGGIEAGDAAAADARAPDAARPEAGEAGLAESPGDSGDAPTFAVGGSECSYRRSRREAEPLAAITMSLLPLALFRRRRRHPALRRNEAGRVACGAPERYAVATMNPPHVRWMAIAAGTLLASCGGPPGEATGDDGGNPSDGSGDANLRDRSSGSDGPGNGDAGGGRDSTSPSEASTTCGAPCPKGYTCGTANGKPVCRAPSGIPMFSHIFLILMENTSLSTLTPAMTGGKAPNLAALAAMNATGSAYHGVSHPSLPNYIALSSGGTQGVGCDCHAQPGQGTCSIATCNLALGSCTCDLSATNLADQIEGAKETWMAFGEGMSTPCNDQDDSTTQYAVRHVPFIYYDDIRTDTARCNAHVVDFMSFDPGSASQFTFIAPNLTDDMHNPIPATTENITNGDKWIGPEIAKIVATPSYSDGGLIVIVWDEDDDSGGISGTDDPVPIFVLSPYAKAGGYVSAVEADHYSLLATIEDAMNLARLGSAGMTRPMKADTLADFFPSK
jgi:hypothetical protein